MSKGTNALVWMVPPSSPLTLMISTVEYGDQVISVPANGSAQVPASQIAALMGAGWVIAPASGTTANRPTTGLSPGQPYFDTTLGKSVWRNAANSGWVDATGTAA